MILELEFSFQYLIILETKPVCLIIVLNIFVFENYARNAYNFLYENGKEQYQKIGEQFALVLYLVYFRNVIC